MSAVTIADAAAALQVSERTIRRWLATGKVRHWVVSERERYVDILSAAEYQTALHLSTPSGNISNVGHISSDDGGPTSHV